MKKVNGYREAVETAHVSRMSGKEEVFLAFDNTTDAYLGPAIHRSAFGARERAAWLYAVPLDTVWVRKRA